MSDLDLRILATFQDRASGPLGGLKNALENLVFGFRNLGTAGTVGTDALKQGAIGAGGALLKIGAIAGLAGIAIATGIGVAGVKAAGDFQEGLTILSTGAGETQRNLGMVGEGIKQISIDTATSTDQLLKGMFMVESGGYHGADGLNVMRVASMGARLEGADLGAVAFSLTGLLHDYGMKSTDAAAAMNGLIATESSGKMKMQDLTTSLGRVLPVASALGVKFPQVGGALAVMTNANMTARQAAMNLGTTLRALAAPSGIAEKSMKTVGLSAQQVKDTLSHQGLAAALQLIEDHVGHKFPKSSVEYVKAMKNILGGATGYNVALMLTGPHMKEYLANIEKITAAMNGGKKGVEGWDQVQSTFNFKLDQAKEAFHVLLITIGQQLLPTLSQLMTLIIPLIVSFARWIVDSGIIATAMSTLVGAIQRVIAIGAGIVSFFQKNELAMSLLKGTLITVAAIIAGLMVAALYAWAAAAWAAAAGMIAATWPILLIIAAIALLVGILIYAYQHWTLFRNGVNAVVGVLKQLWAVIVQAASAFIGLISPAIAACGRFFQQLWAILQRGWALVLQGVAYLSGLAHTLGGLLMPFITMIVNIIRGQFIPVWQSVQQAIAKLRPIFAQLVSAFAGMGPVVKQLVGSVTLLRPTFDAAWQAMQKIWQIIAPHLLPALEGLGIIIGGLLVLALGILVGGLTAVTGALAQFLMGVMKVITGIIQMFTGFVQIFSGLAQLISDILTGKWGKLAADLGLIWQGILNVLKGLMTMMEGIIQATLGAIYGFVSGWIQGVIGFFTTLYHTIVGGSIIPDMVNGILTWFQNLISAGVALIMNFVSSILSAILQLEVMVLSYINAMVQMALAYINMWVSEAIALALSLAARFSAAILMLEARVLATVSAMVAMFLSWLDRLTGGAVSKASALVSGIAGVLGRLPGIALKAGQALISSLVGAINGGIGAVGGAINNVVGMIRSHLPFSPAKRGPLKDLDKTGPALAATFSAGIIKSVPKVEAAMNLMLQPVARQMQPGTVAPRGVAPAMTQAGPGASGGPGVTVHIEHIHVNDFGPNMPRSVAERLTDEVNKRLANRYRSQYTAASSGFY